MPGFPGASPPGTPPSGARGSAGDARSRRSTRDGASPSAEARSRRTTRDGAPPSAEARSRRPTGDSSPPSSGTASPSRVSTPPRSRGGGGGGGGRARGGSIVLSSALGTLRATQEAADRRERRKREEAERVRLERSRNVYAPLQTRLERMLAARFAPLHVRVRNLSYIFEQKHLLGPTKARYRGVQQHSQSRLFEASIYEYRFDDTALEEIPVKVSLGATFPTHAKALRAADEAARRRDANPGEAEGIKDVVPEDIKATHFHVTLVSDAFATLSLQERHIAVFEALMDEFRPPEAFVPPAPSRMRGFGTVGTAVANLQHVRFRVPDDFPSVMWELKTPGQWDPAKYDASLSERFGASHLEAHSLAKAEKTKVTAGILRKLIQRSIEEQAREQEESAEPAEGESKGEPEAAKPKKGGRKKAAGRKKKATRRRRPKPNPYGNPQDQDMTALDDAAAAISRSRRTMKNDVFGHFFHSQGIETKQIMMQEYQDELARMHRAGLDLPANTKDDTAVSYFVTAQKRYVYAARALQRLLRLKLFPRYARACIRRHRAATDIARVYRGYRARLYVRLYRFVAHQAAVKIQSRYRATRVARAVNDWRQRMIAGARAVQFQVRAWIKRRREAHLRRNLNAAVTLQRVGRGYLARKLYRRIKADHTFWFVQTPAAINIQRVFRGHKGRTLVRNLRWARHHEHVILPATLFVQRVFRGHQARRRARGLRSRKSAATRIQAVARRFRQRLEFVQICRHVREFSAATRIQAMVRGALARSVFDLRLRRHYFNTVVVVAAVRIQACYRAHRARLEWITFRNNWSAAIVVQRAYRRRVKHMAQQRAWEQAKDMYLARLAIKLQSLYRGFAARKLRRELNFKRLAHEHAAATKVQACWARFLAYRRYRALKDVWDIEHGNEVLAECRREHDSIEADMADVREELAIAQKRHTRVDRQIRTLRSARERLERRLPQIEDELQDLDDDDLEHGWPEAFEEEFNATVNRLEMLAEDMTGKRVQLRDTHEEIKLLKLELEDLEIDLDENWVIEAEEMETLRRLELGRCDARRKAHWDRKVREERCRWQISTVRRSVVLRQRDDLHRIAKETHKALSTSLAFDTVTYQRIRMRQQLRAQLDAEKREEEQRQRDAEAATGGRGALVIKQTFDRVVQESRQLLRRDLRDMRINKQDSRTNPRAMCATCGLVYCTCADNPMSYKHARVHKDGRFF